MCVQPTTYSLLSVLLIHTRYLPPPPCPSRAPILLPILQPDYVADNIVLAAEQNRNLLNMPRYAYILQAVGAVPCRVKDFIYDFMGVGENMADFKQTKAYVLKDQ